jgi:hypothetical protein
MNGGWTSLIFDVNNVKWSLSRSARSSCLAAFCWILSMCVEEIFHANHDNQIIFQFTKKLKNSRRRSRQRNKTLVILNERRFLSGATKTIFPRVCVCLWFNGTNLFAMHSTIENYVKKMFYHLPSPLFFTYPTFLSLTYDVLVSHITANWESRLHLRL